MRVSHLAQSPGAVPQEMDLLAERHTLAQPRRQSEHDVERGRCFQCDMRDDPDHLRQEARQARWWAVATSDPEDRARIEAAAREYENMAETAESWQPDQQFGR